MLHALVRGVLLGVFLAGATRQARAATYYVAATGSDAAAGSFAAPWRTIQKAAGLAVAGDTVYVRTGTYRETVTFANNGTAGAPITLQNYPGETPTLTGLDLIAPGSGGAGAWTQHSGNVWKIQLTSAHGFGAGSTGRNQVAIDGTMLSEARWPNSSVYADVNRTSMALSDAGSVDPASRDTQGLYTCTYTDAALAAFATGAWTGATMRVAVGKQWTPAAGSVTASTASALTFKYRYLGGGNDTPAKDDPYFLFGRLVALDAEGEFFLDDSARDGAAFTLYAYKPGGGSPAASALEVRTRDLGLDLSGRRYVNVTGLRFLAARVTTSTATSNCTLDRLALDYAGHNLGLLAAANGDSVTLAGATNALTNSTIAYATQFGVVFTASATNCTVDNNAIHHCGFSGISAGDSRAPLVQHNTIRDTGSFCIVYNAKAGRFLFNHVYYGGTYCVDIGLINTFSIGDAEGVEVAYNWAHDNLAPYDLSPIRGWNGGCGIRADCGFGPFASLNLVFHHNVVWNTTHPGSIVFWGVTDAQWAATARTYAQGSSTIDTREFAYHNTLQKNIEYGAGRAGGVPIFASGGRVKNNLLSGTFSPNGVNTSGVEADTNLVASTVTGFANNTVTTATFVSPLEDNFAIPAAAVDAGAVIAPYTDGYAGTKPDLGAYESGGEFWIPGATVLAEQVPALTATYSAATGRVTLSGFPSGRSVPTPTKIKIGPATSTTVRPHLDLVTHSFTAAFAIDVTGIGGVQTVALSLDGTDFTALTIPITLPGAQTTVAGYDPGRLINLSILTSVSAADPSFTVGAVVGGNGTGGAKPLLIRAVGPSLTPLGVAGALPDPNLVVLSGATSVASSNDWIDGGTATLTALFVRVGAFAYASATSKDAAVAFSPNLTAPSANYTVRVGGNGGSGTVLAELYDATPNGTFTPTTPRLVNVSVLKQIPAGTSLTAGFVVGGTTSKQVLVRAIGPTLGTAFEVGGAMADPKIDLFDGSQNVVASNNDWGGGAALAAAFVNVGAFALPAGSKDAAVIIALAPGNYTAQVSGVGSTGGTALVEVYEVP